MSDLTRDQIRVAGAYEAERDAERRHQVDIKRHRRINLGHRLSLVFENQDTVRAALEEVVRTERITDAAGIDTEVDAFARMIPGAGELSAVLYLEVADPAHLDEAAEELAGAGEHLTLAVAGETVAAVSELVDTELGPPAVTQVRFAISEPLRAAWLEGAPVALHMAHPACAVSVELSDEQRAALAADLR